MKAAFTTGVVQLSQQSSSENHSGTATAMSRLLAPAFPLSAYLILQGSFDPPANHPWLCIAFG